MSRWKLCNVYMADLDPGSKNKWGGEGRLDLTEILGSCTSLMCVYQVKKASVLQPECKISIRNKFYHSSKIGM